MDFKTFDRCMTLLRAWRSRTSKDNWEYPDSRNPDLREILSEFGVVPQDLEKSMSALAAWREADEDVYQAMSTILHVIKNRQAKGMFRTHLTSEQFPTMSEPGPKENSYPIETENFKKVLENLDQILENKTSDLTQGAIYFGIVGENMVQWFKDIVESPDMMRTTMVGRMTFYKKKV